MNVYLTEDGEALRGDLVIEWIMRSALAPIPRTVEITIRNLDDMKEKLVEGAKLWTGREKLKYHIVKVEAPKPSAVIQGDSQLSAIKVTALLDMSHKVAYRQPRAIIKEDVRFSEVYRACGGTAPVRDDFVVRRFSCFRGMVPTFHLAQVLQEEAGVIVLRDKQLSFVRIKDLAKQKAVKQIAQTDSTDLITSEFLERHEIPSFFSIADDGSFVMGDETDDRASAYAPRTNARSLVNMTNVMVERRIVRANICQDVQAGDVIDITGQPFVVMTAVHCFRQGDQAQGQTESFSKMWVGSMSA